MARDLRSITRDYWDVSHILRCPHSTCTVTTEQAFRRLSSADRLRPGDWRLSELMHTIRFDIIEGHTEWREKQQEPGLVLTLPTKVWTSTHKVLEGSSQMITRSL